MHPRVIAASLVGTTLVGAGAVLALVFSGTALYIPDWPDLGLIGWLLGVPLVVVGLVGPPLLLRWVHPERSVIDGAMAGILTAITPVYAILGPWLGLIASEPGRVQAELGALEGPAFAEFISQLTLAQVFWVPAGLAAAVLSWAIVAGCICGVLGAPLTHAPRRLRISWFPAWIVYISGSMFVVQIAAFNSLGQSIGAAMGEQGPMAALAVDFMPLFLLMVQAIAVGTTARQAPAAWFGGDRVGAIVIAGSVGLLVVAELCVVALIHPLWATIHLVAMVFALGVGAAFAWMDDAPAPARGSAALPDLILRAVGLTLLGTALVIGPGGILMGLMMALTVVPLIAPLAGETSHLAEIRPGLAEIWPLVGWCSATLAGTLVLQFAIGLGVRWAIRRAMRGPTPPAERPSAAWVDTPRFVEPPPNSGPYAPPGYAD